MYWDGFASGLLKRALVWIRSCWSMQYLTIKYPVDAKQKSRV